VERGGGGSDSFAPLNISPFTTLFGNGTRNFPNGTHNLLNGAPICQKGPDISQMTLFCQGDSRSPDGYPRLRSAAIKGLLWAWSPSVRQIVDSGLSGYISRVLLCAFLGAGRGKAGDC
jgi:hypothetical protein